MKIFRVWVPLFLLICLSGVLGITLFMGDPSAVASPMLGKPAPVLQNPTLDDKGALTPDELKGKPHLVNFFASWCGPCAMENPMLMALASKHQIEIIGVATRDSSDPLQAYLDKRGNPYSRVALDADGKTAIDWGVSGVPETFAVDANGVVVDRHIAGLTSGDIERLLKSVQVTLSDTDRADLRTAEKIIEERENRQ